MSDLKFSAGAGNRDRTHVSCFARGSGCGILVFSGGRMHRLSFIDSRSAPRFVGKKKRASVGSTGTSGVSDDVSNWSDVSPKPRYTNT